MNRGKAVKPLKELNLTNRFLFDEVMEDAETHRTVLSIIFGRDIPPLIHNETEKEAVYRRQFVQFEWMCFPWMKMKLFIIRKCRQKEDGSGKKEAVIIRR